MTLTYEEASDRETPIGSPVSIIIWSFLSSAGGAASEQTKKVSGKVKRMVTNPDNTDTPDANWDLTITDEDGVDILEGEGANRDPAGAGTSEGYAFTISELIASKLTFTVANAGAAKKGVVKLYLT
ncbi:MAG: hypothetical protein WA977_02415 [Halobacteriota archaeon]